MLSERIKRLRDRQRSTTPTICLDRARLVTKYYQGVATEPNTLRRAKFFKYFLENRSIFIDPDSILAGHMASRLVGCHIFASAPLMSSMSCAYTVPVLLIRRAI